MKKAIIVFITIITILLGSNLLQGQYNYQSLPIVNSYPIYSGEYINYGNYNYNYNTNIYGTISNRIEATNDYDAYLKYEYQYKYNYSYDYNGYNAQIGKGVIKDFNGEYYIINLYEKKY